jgi:hypothetical protein
MCLCICSGPLVVSRRLWLPPILCIRSGTFLFFVLGVHFAPAGRNEHQEQQHRFSLFV